MVSNERYKLNLIVIVFIDVVFKLLYKFSTTKYTS